MFRNTIAGIALALIMALALLGSASAHANLVSSEPKDGAQLDKPPAKITLVFDDEIDSAKSGFTVTDSGGAKVGEGNLDLDDIDRKTLTGTMDANAGDGVYSIAWAAYTADDDNTEEGTVTFTVGAAQTHPTSAAQPTTAAQPTARPAATAQPVTQPTATEQPATAPSNLPQTGAGGSNVIEYGLLGAIIILVGGLLLRFSRARVRH